MLAILVLAVSIAEPRFLNAQNLRDILLNVTIVALLAVGQTIVVVTRNIDLSVGSVLGITAFATGVMFADHGLPIPLVFVARHAVRRVLRADERRHGRVGARAVAGDHARHAVRDPRHRLRVGPRPPDQRGRHARRLPAPRHAQHPRLPGPAAVHDRRDGRSSASCSAARRMGRELYAIGSNPDAAVLAGIRVEPPRARRVRRLRRDRRPRGRALRLPLRHAGRRRGQRHRARRGLRGGRRRRRDLRRLGHRLRRRARRAAAGHDPLRARDPAGQPLLGAGDQRRAAAARDRPRRLPGARDWPANCARGARTVSEINVEGKCTERSLARALGDGHRLPADRLDPLRHLDVRGLPHAAATSTRSSPTSRRSR